MFVRAELGHGTPATTLYVDQEALAAALRDLQQRGVPLRGLLVIELAAERYDETLWAKWGTWRIGERTVLEHIADGLRAINTAEGGGVWLPDWRKRRPWGWMRPRLGGPPDP